MNNVIEYPVGSIYITSTNTNPEDLGLPGMWVLIDKKFKDFDSSMVFTFNNSLTTMPPTNSLHFQDVNGTKYKGITYNEPYLTYINLQDEAVPAYRPNMGWISPYQTIIITSDYMQDSAMAQWLLTQASNDYSSAIWSDNSTYFTCSHLTCKRSGHGIDIDVNGITNAAIGSDTNATLGFISPSTNLGISSNVVENYFITAADETSTIASTQWYHIGPTSGSTGRIATADVIRNAHDDGSLPSGSAVQLHFRQVFGINDILDSACDKFYWKKITDDGELPAFKGLTKGTNVTGFYSTFATAQDASSLALSAASVDTIVYLRYTPNSTQPLWVYSGSTGIPYSCDASNIAHFTMPHGTVTASCASTKPY